MGYQGNLADARYGGLEIAPPPCGNQRIPAPDTIKPVTPRKGFGRCGQAGGFGVANPGVVISTAIARALEMIDNTIGELVNARTRVCQGEAPAWPLLGDITLDWLRNRLSICIDDIRTWTAGTFVNRSVAEVIRR